MTVVRAAITQTTWTGDKESMLAKHEQCARDAAADGAAAAASSPAGALPAVCANTGATEATLSTTDVNSTAHFFAGEDVISLSSRIGKYSTAKRP